VVEMPKGGPAPSSEPPGLLGGDVRPERSSLPFRRHAFSESGRCCKKPVSENSVSRDLAVPALSRTRLIVSGAGEAYDSGYWRSQEAENTARQAREELRACEGAIRFVVSYAGLQVEPGAVTAAVTALVRRHRRRVHSGRADQEVDSEPAGAEDQAPWSKPRSPPPRRPCSSRRDP
jgi:hypothetical protein